MEHISPRLFAYLVGLAIALRVVLVFGVPFSFVPDIFCYDTQAVRALVNGLDPYGFGYSSYCVVQTAGAQNVFAYLPGVFLILVPSGVLTDVRMGLVACDLLIALSLYFLGQKGRLAGLVFLFFPTDILFSTWYPNNTLIAMTLLSVSVCLGLKGSRIGSSALLGLALASSQFVILAFPLLLCDQLRKRRWSQILVTVAAAFLVTIPFLIWNPGSFLNNVVYFESNRPVQQLVTTEPFGFNVNPTMSGIALTFFGASVPVWVKGGILILILAALLLGRQQSKVRWLDISVFLVAVIFILPDDFSWWYLELPFLSSLLWFALGEATGQQEPANP